MSERSPLSLAHLRETAGLSLEEAARALEMPTEALQQLEADPTQADAALLARITGHYQALTSADTDHLVRAFLQTDQPSRGQLFKDFVSTFRKPR